LEWEGRVRVKNNFYKRGFFFMLGIFLLGAYANYDYWAFKLLVANNYVFTDALDEFYSRHIDENNRRGFFRDFDRVVISEITSRLSEIENDRYTYLYSPQEVRDAREIDRAIAKSAEIFALDDDTIFLYVPNISRRSRKFVYENRELMARYPNLVLDLRGNYGGWIAEFHKIAELFTPKGAVLSRTEARAPFFSQTKISRRDAFFRFEKIIILQNNFTASAAEGLIMALREHTNAVAVGQTTFGKGTGQVTIPLTGGYAVRATVMQVLGPQRECIHLTGIAPNIVIGSEVDVIEKVMGLIELGK
jgi:hypothetical protein